MSWLIARYDPVSLFSLRPHNATASGGKTLIAPTAFAIKMALLNAVIQTAGLEVGKRRFDSIRSLRVALALPKQVVVVKSFAKVLRAAAFKGKTEDRHAWEVDQIEKMAYPFATTIAYRELVQFDGPLQFAFTTDASEPPAWLGEALLGINYFGRRGGFVQITARPILADGLDATFTEITSDATSFPLEGTLQLLDDCGDKMTFAHADIYDPKRITVGKERVIRHVVLPYKLAQSSRGYSRYERIGEGAVQ